jgi:hypothetical protein
MTPDRPTRADLLARLRYLRRFERNHGESLYSHTGRIMDDPWVFAAEHGIGKQRKNADIPTAPRVKE